jgi:predicted dehydrogenase
LLASTQIDAVYIPLPNALHRDWAINALNAGLHVLCEKPLASNASLASEVVAVASRVGRVVVEGFHWRRHPLASRLIGIIASERIGTITNIRSWFLIPKRLFTPDNIRFNFALGGGSVMDNGCYCINLIRLIGGEPHVISAKATLAADQVDGAMTANFRLSTGATASMESSMVYEGDTIENGAEVVGTRGSITVINPFIPSFGAVIKVKSDEGNLEETPTTISSFYFQANSFAQTVRDFPEPTLVDDNPVANMEAIDAVYRAAGLALRP